MVVCSSARMLTRTMANYGSRRHNQCRSGTRATRLSQLAAQLIVDSCASIKARYDAAYYKTSRADRLTASLEKLERMRLIIQY
jgi:hypothetical protein